MHTLVLAGSLGRSPVGCGRRAKAILVSHHGLSVVRFILVGMRPVCFLSDFGLADDFVGTCKGVMLRIAPGVSIVDLTHEVPGFEVEAGAEILRARHPLHAG